MDEQLVLSHDPFAWDFEGSGSGDRVLRDKMVTARKTGECHHCGETIQPGTRVRARSEVYDDELMAFRWCQPCCEAMAASDNDDGAALEARARNFLT